MFDTCSIFDNDCCTCCFMLPSMRTTNMERATLKIEIPFTDHAHCIGRQGNQIQSIMSATDTHIHFPDGNREPNGTKSNQVSITGTVSSIEEARKRIREILPMSLKFLIPPTELINIINDDYPLFKNVRTRFGVIVLPRPYAKTGDVYCIVRGLINQPGLAEATEYLIQAFYGFEAPLIKVTCQTEVSEQYHVYLQTRQQSKDMCIAAIEQYTHTTIQFPTMINSNLSQDNTNNYGRRTSVIISGSPTQVCQARKLFDLCLPVILNFEIPIDKEPTRAQTAHIKDKLNVTTTVRTRKDKIGKLVTVQSQEYNCDQLFRARAIILGLSESTNNHILPINTNALFDLNQTSTFLSDLSCELPTASSSLFLTSSSAATTTTNHMTDSILIPIEPCYIPPTQQIDTVLVPIVETSTAKKPSPIGHERSSSRNLDQESIIWPTNNDRIPSLFVFDSSTQQTLKPTDINNLESIDNTLAFPIQDNCSTKLLTLLRSLNLEKYWSTFERNEIDYCTFLSMTDHDLTQIGIEAFGARRRMQQAIADHALANINRY
ncbi:unnamed protein product [Rotaria sordida]|uniref:SAM domain-containing protein n=1 Tax=Rotaria sordida TaxID=392033 RepID=A0A814A2A4_9BILA|nr:unnamed protein product [Rotaria sordida]CAF0833875.1 unnamed protein product [Rotaria sordida]CAF0870883.1 unnamed protein product [Rotaria sordida]CAF0875331.1 unnamed protein product [Rotaria sordida]CAF0907727.1 unnamed protein product [Rotaria sordida]